MAHASPYAAALALAAALAVATPAAASAPAADLPPAPPGGTSAALLDPFSTSTYDPAAEIADWRRCGWRGCWRGRGRRGVRTGDVLAGVAILGGIAAIASAANNNRNRERDVVIVERDRDNRDRDNRDWDRDRYERDRYERDRYERDRYERELERDLERDREIEDLRRRTEDQQREIEDLRRRGIDAQPLAGDRTVLAPLPPVAQFPGGRAQTAPYRVTEPVAPPQARPLPPPLPEPGRLSEPVPLRGADTLEEAVARCTEVIAIDENVAGIDGAVRTTDGWSVRGRLASGQGFTCRVDRSGDIRSLENNDVAGAAPTPIGDTRPPGGAPASGQWSDARYADARSAMAAPERPARPLVPLTAERMPAYPGGPVPGED